MVGHDSEQEGIIRRGAKMVNAVSNSVVPKLTVVTGGSYGAGNYAMSGKAFAPRFLFLWPSAKHSLMSGNSAAKTLMDVRVQQHARTGQALDEEDLNTPHTTCGRPRSIWSHCGSLNWLDQRLGFGVSPSTALPGTVQSISTKEEVATLFSAALAGRQSPSACVYTEAVCAAGLGAWALGDVPQALRARVSPVNPVNPVSILFMVMVSPGGE